MLIGAKKSIHFVDNGIHQSVLQPHEISISNAYERQKHGLCFSPIPLLPPLIKATHLLCNHVTRSSTELRTRKSFNILGLQKCTLYRYPAFTAGNEV